MVNTGADESKEAEFNFAPPADKPGGHPGFSNLQRKENRGLYLGLQKDKARTNLYMSFKVKVLIEVSGKWSFDPKGEQGLLVSVSLDRERHAILVTKHDRGFNLKACGEVTIPFRALSTEDQDHLKQSLAGKYITMDRINWYEGGIVIRLDDTTTHRPQPVTAVKQDPTAQSA